jgi:hypothetical protein
MLGTLWNSSYELIQHLKKCKQANNEEEERLVKRHIANIW